MYNPYLNQYYGTQPMNRPQPMEIPMQQQTTPQIGLNRAFLNGKQVDSIDTVKSMDIPLDGSISYFPLANGSAIVTKQLQQDGTSKITIYEPKTQKNDIKFATIEDIDKRIEKIDFSEIDDLKDDLEDLKKELKDIKNKLKTKKED
nr:MAG TPA: protein of unknown function (DUF5320) [Caudoviricetes sp.]